MNVRMVFAAGLFFASAVLAAAPLAAEDQIPWAADFVQAAQQAGAQGKLVLLHFYSDDCPPCMRVERNVFSQQEVAAAVARHYVPVKVHARKSPELAARYRVQQWPTDVVVTAAGLEVTRSISPQSPAAYINMVNSIAGTAGSAGQPTVAAAAQLAAPSPAHSNGLPGPQSMAPWIAPSASEAASQVSGQAAWMAGNVANTAQQFQQSAHQATHQAWQQAQTQANQAVINTNQFANQASQTAHQSTQAAADAAKEVINRYSQPIPQTPGAPAWQPPYVAGSPGGVMAAAPSPAHRDPTVQSSASAPANTVAATSYPIAMEGYCPVTLTTERKWKKGQPQFGARHRSRTFLFASETAQQQFLAEPDRFTPVMVGYDPVKFMQTGELIDGRAAFSLTYRKEVYLFTDDASLKAFWQNPPQFTEGLRQAMLRAESSRTLR